MILTSQKQNTCKNFYMVPNEIMRLGYRLVKSQYITILFIAKIINPISAIRATEKWVRL